MGGLVSVIYEILLADTRVHEQWKKHLLQTCFPSQHVELQDMKEDAQQFMFQKAFQVILMNNQV